MDTWKIFTWGIVLFAVLLSAAASYGIAWGHGDFPADATSASRTGVSTANIISAVSSSSVNTVLAAWGQSTGGAVTTYTCGPTTMFAVPNITNALSEVFLQSTCTGYSVKFTISSGTGPQSVVYIEGTPTPASLGEISVDTAGVETQISMLTQGIVVASGFFLFLLAFSVKLNAFRHKRK